METFSLLDWVLRSLSFLNAILALWLGLTVLLNAERRTWGTWLAGGGLVLNGIFFTVHSGIVGRDLSALAAELPMWWPAILLPFVGLPYLWYVVMAWYSRRLHSVGERAILGIVSALAVVALLGVGLASPGVATLGAAAEAGRSGIATSPPSALIFPLYSVLCIALALDAVRRPRAGDRFMGDAARERARPWLIGTSLVLLAISAVAGSALVWLQSVLTLQEIELFSLSTLTTLKLLDLVVSGLVGLAIVFVGQAAVSYEVFTGHVLPRRGLHRQWRGLLVIAAAFAGIVALGLGLPLDPVFVLLTAMLLLTLALAVQGRRAYLERQQTTDTLRALLESDHAYERVLEMPGGSVHESEPFTILCRDVLGAEVGYLMSDGPLASLAGPPARYPDSAGAPPVLNGLTRGLASSSCLPLDPKAHGGARWAIRLGAHAPSKGVLLLGRKIDGSLYTDEEIALARVAGERLIDARASAELARRLIAVQRGRFAESQVADRQTRRLLHDEVLPRLHTAILRTAEETTGRDLADLHRLISDALHALQPSFSGRAAREGLIPALRHLVDEEMAGSFERADVHVADGAEEAAHGLSELSREAAYGAARELVRNAARHGRGDEAGRSLELDVTIEFGDGLRIVVTDNGVGFDAAPSGGAVGGSGLVLHTTMMAVVGGSLQVNSAPGSGTQAVVALPLQPEVSGLRLTGQGWTSSSGDD